MLDHVDTFFLAPARDRSCIARQFFGAAGGGDLSMPPACKQSGDGRETGHHGGDGEHMSRIDERNGQMLIPGWFGHG